MIGTALIRVAEREVFCNKRTRTYAGVFHRGNGAGSKSNGGFATHWRGPSAFAYPIPAGYDPACAAPMMCAGITVFSALRRFGAGVTAKQVGVIGIGGLGHLAIQFAKAMGAEVTAISRGEAKRQEAAKLGSSNYIAVSDDVATSVKGCERTLDLVICCTGRSRLHIPLDLVRVSTAAGQLTTHQGAPTPTTSSC
jgi:alcohol dehydrogenase (NADP+)